MKRIFALGFLSAALCGDSSAAVFPTVTASNLNKEEVTLPGGLEGEWNLVILGFEREHQGAIDTWLAVLPEIVSKHPGLAYYEVPVIGRVNFFVRWWIDRGMRSGIPDVAQRARTITLYLDKGPFREALQIPSEDRIHLVLIDRSGKVLWRAEGPVDEAKRESLRGYLAASTGGSESKKPDLGVRRGPGGPTYLFAACSVFPMTRSIADVGIGVAHFDHSPDQDGVLRDVFQTFGHHARRFMAITRSRWSR